MIKQSNATGSRFSAVAGWAKMLIRRQTRNILAVFVLTLATVSGLAQGAPLGKAVTVIEDTDNASAIVRFLHFFSDYKGFKYLETDSVIDNSGQTISGQSALVYRFYCDTDDNTDVVFFVNQSGQIYQTRISRSTGAPFLAANFSMQVLGRMVINSDDKMTAADKERALKLMDDADAHGLMDLWLAMKTL